MMQKIHDVLKSHWGYEEFWPLQEQAIACVLGGRDSVVVMPTGGGKSLCYQAPALVTSGLAVVVSPLVSLMKDQVDALLECGVPAARLDSTQSDRERDEAFIGIHDGSVRLLYVTPERLVSNSFLGLLSNREVSFIAVDEAHCVSMWGHDFRPEYRELAMLREALPGVAIHAYTATATEQVRGDIRDGLRMEEPEILVGSFHRPNLVYGAQRRTNRIQQVCDVLDRHKGESGIVYCIRRTDVDTLCDQLRDRGQRAVPYHAGLEKEERRESQDAFMREDADTIVATVAFGMGIDKSNVRYVIHAGLPKSIEHYQQESGRAGRDGLEAECTLFYSGGDYGTWKRIMADMEPEPQSVALSKLNEMYEYCTGVTCRHATLLEYFGQRLEADDCKACDVCLGKLEYLEESLTVGQKILSCVVRLGEGFGGDYTADVLAGSRNKRVLGNGHDRLSTHGILAEFGKRVTRDWIEQLVAQRHLEKVGEFNVLAVTEKGWRLLKGRGKPRLAKAAAVSPRESKGTERSWEGVDKGLFEALRELRRNIAKENDVPAFVVFGDVALRDMARRRPSTLEAFLHVKGVGEVKRERYGAEFVELIKEYCRQNDLQMDVPSEQFSEGSVRSGSGD